MNRSEWMDGWMNLKWIWVRLYSSMSTGTWPLTQTSRRLPELCAAALFNWRWTCESATYITSLSKLAVSPPLLRRNTAPYCSCSSVGGNWVMDCRKKKVLRWILRASRHRDQSVLPLNCIGAVKLPSGTLGWIEKAVVNDAKCLNGMPSDWTSGTFSHISLTPRAALNIHPILLAPHRFTTMRNMCD